MAPPNTAINQGRFGLPSSAMKTPHTISRIPFSEMHPSKVHSSTIKDSTGENHGQTMGTPQSSIKKVGSQIADNTPSRHTSSPSKNLSSPTFDFTFDRPDSDLSAEAQKIMDSVREEAAKIKAQMMRERDKQQQKDGEAGTMQGFALRKIANPKGKAGRFSDVHKQEFQKMDSIANHVSTWKTKMNDDAQCLKGSPSKAGLEESTPKSLPRSKSMRSLRFGGYDKTEHTSSPGKRMRREYSDDASTARPGSRDANESMPNTPAKAHVPSKLPSAVSTPTKASLARSASVKNMKTSMIPLSRSSSTRTLGNLTMPKSEGGHKYLASLSRFGSVKSILQRSPSKQSEDKKVDTAPIQSPSKMNIDKELPTLPDNPAKVGSCTPTTKRVDFAQGSNNKLTVSPTRSQLPTPRLYHPSPNQPFSSPTPSKFKPDDPVIYPLLASSPNITTRRHVANVSKEPAGTTTIPGDFTFRTEQTIKFSPDKPLQPKAKPVNTIRQVRPSGLPTPLASTSSFEAIGLPAIPHGINNKKRKHVDEEDDSSDLAFRVPATEARSDEEMQRAAKKQRVDPLSSISPVKLGEVNQTSPLKRRFGLRGGTTPGGSKTGSKTGISLGRLHVLSRPKERK